MSKLYPPYIEGTIPAFSEYRMAVPFVMNKTVSWSQINGFYARIKSVQTNELILNVFSDLENYSIDEQCIYFDISQLKEENGVEKKYTKLKIGSFYKVQIAYRDITGLAGYYSTVGIVKYTAKPTLSIVDLEQGQLHANINSYLGKYSQEGGDVSEKLYSYTFTVYNPDGSVLDSTGAKLHNHENDEQIYESIDSYILNKTLEQDKVYTIQYSGVTANNMVVTSPAYRIIQTATVEPEIKADVTAIMNQENGYADIKLLGHNDETGNEINAVGTFVLSRSSSQDDFKNWYEIKRFALMGELPSKFNCKDFTIEHGYQYQYSLQQYNQQYGVYSNRMLSNIIVANFEHSFLFDGEKQLKIKYNPKVSSFKDTILESKTNTLGAKFPFFYRNGNVSYKEFPISGLISYQMDEEELFLTNEEMKLDNLNSLQREYTLLPNIKSTDEEYFQQLIEETGDYNYVYTLQAQYKKREDANSNELLITNSNQRTTQLTDYNILAERIFKTKVLEWLNNGKPKLFRSPGEGNFLVRLMNSSLSPEDKLNRMLHNFNTTATEIDYPDYLTLGNYNITLISEPNTTQLRWKTLTMEQLLTDSTIEANEEGFISLGNIENIYSIELTGLIAEDRILIISGKGTADDTEIQEIRAGVTGAYYVRFGKSPDEILLHKNNSLGSQITYSYYSNQLQQFDTYRAIHMADIPVKQFIGAQENNSDLLKLIEDIKNKVSKYYFVNFTKRPVAKVTYDENTRVYFLNGISAGTFFDPNPLYLYDVNGVYYDGREYDPLSVDENKGISNISYKVYIDGKQIDLEVINDFCLPTTEEHIPEIILSNGIVADVSIQCRQIEYDVEQYKVNEISNEYRYLDERLEYEEQLNAVQKLIYDTPIEYMRYYWDEQTQEMVVNNEYQSTYENILKQAKSKLQTLYQKYIDAIVYKLNEKGVILE